MSFADKILKLRKQKGLSQEELADKLNVSRQAVSRWEMATAFPDAQNLLIISKLFGVTIDFLVNENYDFENSDCNTNTPYSLSDPKLKLSFFIVLNIIALISEICACIFGDFFSNYFVPQNAYNNDKSIIFIIFFILGILLNIGSIITFQIIYNKKENKKIIILRRKYYQISIWLFSPIIIICLFYTICQKYDCLPIYTSIIVATLIYILICSITTICLKHNKSTNID